MNTPAPKKSRAWTVVVAATAVTAIGGASVAAAWGTQSQSPEAAAVSLSEQRAITTQDHATSAGAVWERAGHQAREWSANSVPADSPFAKASEASPSQEVQSASVQSVQSVASVVSAQSPVSAQSAQSPVSVQSPVSAQSAQSPVSAQSAQSPVSVQSPTSPASPDSPASPQSVDSPDADN